jgi:hypothetical protein
MTVCKTRVWELVKIAYQFMLVSTFITLIPDLVKLSKNYYAYQSNLSSDKYQRAQILTLYFYSPNSDLMKNLIYYIMLSKCRKTDQEREREGLSFTFFSKEITSFDSGVNTFSRFTSKRRCRRTKYSCYFNLKNSQHTSTKL